MTACLAFPAYYYAGSVCTDRPDPAWAGGNYFYADYSRAFACLPFKDLRVALSQNISLYYYSVLQTKCQLKFGYSKP